jgi:pyruvate ferredoxin oxidoreductase gamma subunit
MNQTTQIRIHGRGGQGSVTAAELLAVAAFYDGNYSQAFPNFGVERRGAPVEAFTRLSKKAIRLREQVQNPDYLIIQDPTLLNNPDAILKGSEKAVGVLINTEKSTWPGIKNVMTVPATKIALDEIGKPFINTALLGAFAAMSGLVTIKSLKRAIGERFPSGVAEKNVAALERAYNFVKENK